MLYEFKPFGSEGIGAITIGGTTHQDNEYTRALFQHVEAEMRRLKEEWGCAFMNYYILVTPGPVIPDGW